MGKILPFRAPDGVPHGDVVDAYLRRLAPGSRRAQRSALDSVARLLQPTGGPVAWETLTHARLGMLRDELAGRYQAATVNRYLAAVRGVLRAAWRLGMLDGDTVARIGDVPGMPERALPAGRALGDNELLALVIAAAAQDAPDVAARDAALVSVLVSTGARVGELAGMDAADVVAPDLLVIRHGKGGRAREVPLPPRAAARVASWGVVRARILGASPGTSDALWLRLAGPFPGERLSVRSCYQRLVDAGARAGFELGPHDCRRTYVTRLLGAGLDVLVVGRLVGHASPRTTGVYDRRAIDAARPFLTTVDP
jgi:site-specific recombinase XerD